MSDAPRVETELVPPGPFDLRDTLMPLGRGAGDPSVRLEGGVAWRATRTPMGPATTRIAVRAGRVHVSAWGEGAEWAVEHAGELLGFHDDVSSFRPTGLVAELHARHPGFRIGRTRAVYEAMLRVIPEQKVTTVDAARSYRAMFRAWGTPAPGPLDLRIAPPPDELAKRAYFEFHPFNLEMKRAETLRLVAKRAARLEETVGLPRDEVLKRLTSLQGVGEWTANEVMAVAHGDADAVAVGDWHLKNTVSFAFTGEPRGTDERMLELLAPFAPHRGRVLRLLMLGGVAAPRFGPRMPLRDFRRW